MFDHVTITVADYQRSRDFYLRALEPLGYRCLMEFDGKVGGFGLGSGSDAKPDFWIAQGAAKSTVHLAFTSEDRTKVSAFHAAAVKAGGKDNGGPGPRPHYHRDYYGAFVCDPDGNNIEAVCHQPS